MNITTTHGDKLIALSNNNKLPISDRIKVKEAIEKYNNWRNTLLQIEGDINSIISRSVELLNNYKNYIEVDLIFASTEDFLYRQKDS